MNDENYKEVYYDKYCDDCKYRETDAYKDPCDECLCTPVNYGTHRPINFKRKENT